MPVYKKNMKKLSPLFLALFVIGFTFAQNQPPSLVYIIGTSHTSNGFCNVHVLEK